MVYSWPVALSVVIAIIDKRQQFLEFMAVPNNNANSWHNFNSLIRIAYMFIKIARASILFDPGGVVFSQLFYGYAEESPYHIDLVHAY